MPQGIKTIGINKEMNGNKIKFIHCADLHLDSPFKGISEVSPDTGKLLYDSTFVSFSRIVTAAIDGKNDFVIIAGDIFDEGGGSLKARLCFLQEMERLHEYGIPCFCVNGNHDPAGTWSAALTFPDNVYFFGTKTVERRKVVKNRKIIAEVYGISYPQSVVTENLAARFRKAADCETPAIAVLHANIGNNTGCLPYAPASMDDLLQSNMDYWALGHVHAYRKLRDSHPAIVYSGSIQSRSAAETGRKGCCAVELSGDGNCKTEFLCTDAVRCRQLNIMIDNCENLNSLIDLLRTNCLKLAEEEEGRHLFIRLKLQGGTSLYRELQTPAGIQDLTEAVRAGLAGMQPVVWLENIISACHGVHNLEQLRLDGGFPAEIIDCRDVLMENCRNDIPPADFINVVSGLYDNWSGHRHLDRPEPDDYRKITEEAAVMLLDRILKDMS